MTTKEHIFRIIQPAEEGDVPSKAYDAVMLVAILASLVPLCFKEESAVFAAIELICTILFIADYFLRLLTADLLLGKRVKSFIAYPFTPAAICDLVSILPGLMEINPAFKVLRVARLLKILRLPHHRRLRRHFLRVGCWQDVHDYQFCRWRCFDCSPRWYCDRRVR